MIARWVRVITLAKGRHFLNLLVLHRFRVSSKSYKLAPRIGTRVQCLSTDPSVAFSHSFTSSSASHVVAYEIRQAGYPLCSIGVSDYFPSKITIKKPGPVWKDVLSFGPLLQCYMATFPTSSGGSRFCRQRVTGRSGLFWPAFWRVERRTQVPTKDWARFCHCWWTRSRTRSAMPNEGFHRQLTSNQERFCNDRLGLRNRIFCKRCNLAGRCWCSYRCFLTVRDIFKGKHWSLACTGVFEVRLTMDWWILDESLLDMWSSDGKGWLEHPEDTDILIKPSKLYEVIWSPCKPLKFWLCFLIFWQFCNCQVGLHEEMLHFILQLRLLEWHLHSQFWQKTNQSGLRMNNEL